MVAKAAIGAIGFPLAALLLVGLVLLTPAEAQETKLERSFPNVVMVEGKQQGTTSFGAGIVIGSRAGRVYVATANHVVRSGRDPATEIKVQFRFLPGERFDARLLDTKDNDLDLAVLSVSATGGAVPRDQFNYRVLGKSTSLQRGSDVHPLGYPQAQAWGVGLNPEKVDSLKPTEIAFQSSYIQQGHSGGALLDGCGDIVGLIVRDRTPNGEAVRIESVLEALRNWNYPIDLQASGGCAPAAESQAPVVSRSPNTGVAIPPSSGAILLSDNTQAPVQLTAGTSQKYRLEPDTAGFFHFTPDVTGIFNITVLSEPSRIDVGWVLIDTMMMPLLECDNDVPSRGAESCAAFLNAGMTYFLGVENLTGDEIGEPSEPAEFNITILSQ